jgi:hypothetical protein
MRPFRFAGPCAVALWFAAAAASAQCVNDPAACPTQPVLGSADQGCTGLAELPDLCSCSATSGQFPVGATHVVCFDDLEQLCEFDVIIKDPNPPQITCDPDVTTHPNDPGLCGAVVNYGATATDDCTADSAIVIDCPQSGDFLPVGLNSMGCTATDESGNSASCSRNETIQDVEAPSFPVLSDVTAQSPDGNPVPVGFSVAANDNCSAPAICAPPSGSSFPLGPTTVTCNATDGVNAAAPASFLVTVLASVIVVPTLSEWGLAVLAAAIALLALAILRR